MSEKRPQLAPEVLEQPSTQSAGSKASKEKELRSFTTDATAGSTEQVQPPVPKSVARPIVEVGPLAAEETLHVEALTKAEPVRDPLPMPVARPIVEVVADFPHVEAKNEESTSRAPSKLPRAQTRPIVEVGPLAAEETPRGQRTVATNTNEDKVRK